MTQKVSDHNIDLAILKLLSIGEPEIADLMSGLKMDRLLMETEIQKLRKILISAEKALTQLTSKPEELLKTSELIGVFPRTKDELNKSKSEEEPEKLPAISRFPQHKKGSGGPE